MSTGTTLDEELEEAERDAAALAQYFDGPVARAFMAARAARLRQRAAVIRTEAASMGCVGSGCTSKEHPALHRLTGPIPSETRKPSDVVGWISSEGPQDLAKEVAARIPSETAPAAPKPDEWLEQAAKYVEALAGFQSEDDIATDLHRFAARLRTGTSGERIACLNCRSTVPFDSKAETWCMRCGFKLSHRFEPPAAPKEGTVKP